MHPGHYIDIIVQCQSMGIESAKSTDTLKQQRESIPLSQPAAIRKRLQ